MKLVENLGQWLDFVLFISRLSVRFRRSRVLYDAGSLMTGFCSVRSSTSGGNSFARIYSLQIRCNYISYLFLCFVIIITCHYLFI